MNRGADAAVGSAAANVAGHGVIDIRVRWLWIFRKQCRRAHDLARLAVAALRHVLGDPGLLHGFADVTRADLFDRGHLLAGDSRHRRHAGTRRSAVDMHSASAALRDAATELRAGEI